MATRWKGKHRKRRLIRLDNALFGIRWMRKANHNRILKELNPNGYNRVELNRRYLFLRRFYREAWAEQDAQATHLKLKT
jgi:hypothetical protein